jgi:predicted small lipoprotein YifL
MKRIVCLLLLAALILTAGCGKKSPLEIAESYVGRDVEALIAEIGEPLNREYQTSCAMENAQDGFLDYEGFTVVTMVTEEGESVQRVDIVP